MVQNENCYGVSHNIMKHQKSHASVHIWIFWDMICKINNKVSETTSFFYMSCGHGVIPVVIKKQKINVLIYNFYYGHNEPIVNIITKK